ncbi:hypothetical protein [Limimaricola sp. AA108-03]|uniref:hypothetical protein n=1 Tax=Limimaricola sp. AA108-03 TaxID=3425945 RepID=UPI003D7823CB
MANDAPRSDPIPAPFSGRIDAHETLVRSGGEPSVRGPDDLNEQLRAALQARVTELRSRLEPLIRTIDGEVDIGINSDDGSVSVEV